MPPTSLPTNILFYGDNLKILRDRIPAASVDLVYLDPPFNSNRTYNILFKDEHGKAAEAQIQAFEDTWHWDYAAERAYHDLVTHAPEQVAAMIVAMRQFIGTNQMLAYLVMMAARLVELHRVLKPTGSLYLHCDPTASHYLKTILDAIFGVEQFRNEIIWQRTSAHSDRAQGHVIHMGRIHDTIFYYTKTHAATRNELYQPYSTSYIERFYRYQDSDGRRFRLGDITGPGGAAKGNPRYEFLGVTRYWRYSKERMQTLYDEGRIVQTKPGAVPAYKRYLDEMPGVPLQDIWTDIPPIGAQAAERLGYPTQKPLTLLERIIQASSNPGDIVLDPFCGCGTTVAAAEKLKRQWVGIDITHLAIALQRYRMEQMFPGIQFAVDGEPTDVASARTLADDGPRGRYQFQWWALSLVRARPLGGEAGSKQGKKGSDRGVDGVITFFDEGTTVPKRVPVQVKSGVVRPTDVRDLRGTMEREGAPLGVFLTLEEPTREMRAEAAAAGEYVSPFWGRYPRLQILTIAELLSGKTVQMPRSDTPFQQAQPVVRPEATQLPLG